MKNRTFARTLSIITCLVMVMAMTVVLKPVTVNAASSYTAYVCQTSIVINKKKNAKSSKDKKRIKYRTKVTVVKTVSSNSKGKWQKIKYGGKYYYLYTKKGEKKLSKTRTSYDTYRAACRNEFQLAAINKALYMMDNMKTTYVSGEWKGLKNSKGEYKFCCSGFVTYALNNALQVQDYIPTYRLSSTLETLYNGGTIINGGMVGEFRTVDVCKGKYSSANLQPGDVIFFDEKSSGKCNHCGMYLGNNEFIQITKQWKSICIMPMTGKYKTAFCKAIRYIPDPDNVFPAEQSACIGETTWMYKTMDNTQPEKNRYIELKKGTVIEIEFTNRSKDDYRWAYVKYYYGGQDWYGYVRLNKIQK